jgi:coenzyme PQQ precursor peptide PqqA
MKKIWNKPQVTVQDVGLEVTAYLSAEVDVT